jgi:mannitol 2-dehydrogenase
VVCEPWTQWVLEDSFADGRPPLEDAGVQLVDDVAPYELMKLRLLNAGHQVLAQLGRLAGYEFVHDAAQDPDFRRFLLGYLDEEATPTLAAVPGVDLGEYKRGLIDRFSSPAIRDTVARICAEASDRIPQFLLPVIRANLATGGEIGRAVAVVAAWARSAEGVDDAGRPVELVDSRRDELSARARRSPEDPLAFVSDRELFGDLADDQRFATAYRTALALLGDRGARALVAGFGR